MNKQICPLCLHQNRCDVSAKQDCWCNKVVVPQGLIDLLAEAVKDKQCICNVCISRYVADPENFKVKTLTDKPDLSYPVTD
ncbi:hypothetical protein DS885_12725 [Psychromonas sp. B3M02]|uniref:cysteine-rich CWC family protein n=1 Tax=unclassified Psychromonas TaxID=2614957 RepID=UPI000DEB8DE4|nr:cysteine-rich CWC family protein [Psychromonas sp. B3M02]RBW43795.1 hypothetical protein DS885_12725 [Psychromonas sp. B3M02]